MKRARGFGFFFLVMLFGVAERVPASYFFLPPSATEVGPVTKQKAGEIASDLFFLYFAPVFQVTGKTLHLESRWEDPYFGASALKDVPPGVVAIFARGGMVRVPQMTEEILALVFCHELGHVLGGEPYQDIPGSEWSSVEGQADFFAASQCLPRYFLSRSDTPLSAGELRNKVLETSLAAVRLFQNYSFQTEDPVSLERTAPEVATQLSRNTYPSLQCRLDTFKAAAQCLSEPLPSRPHRFTQGVTQGVAQRVAQGDFAITADVKCKAPACWLPR